MSRSYEQDPSVLTLDERLTALAAVEAEIARLQARSVRFVAAIVDDPGADTPASLLEKDYLGEEVRTVLRESATSVKNRIALARTLTTRLPATLAGMERGELTQRHAWLLADATVGLPAADTSRIEAACVPFAAGRDTTAFARKVRREVLALDSRSIEERTLAALSERRVWTSPNRDGATATFGAVLPADGAQLLRTALDIAATTHTAATSTQIADADADADGDSQAKRERTKDLRTKDQRRADALVQFGIDALNRFRGCPTCRTLVVPDNTDDANEIDEGSGAVGRSSGTVLTRWHGARPTIQVVVALSTLLGLDDQPGDLSGHGPIPAELARHIAADPSGTWRRLVTDARGRLLDYGRTRYRPPADLREFVLARDQTCRFPGCYRPACHCELDHVIAWTDGGTTSPTNTVPMCCRHHHVKHDTDWTITAHPDGTHTWTSPTGRHYTIDPTTFPADHTLDADSTDRPELPRAG